jgi:O-antigen ligase
MNLRTLSIPLKLTPIVSSIATLAICSIFVIGSRNPLAVISVELPESRVLFWAFTAVIIAVLFRFFSGVKLNGGVSSANKKMHLWMLPLIYFLILVSFSSFSSRPLEEIYQLAAIAILIAAAVIASPLMRAENLAMFWLVIVGFLTFVLVLSWVSGPQGPDGSYEALSVGRITFGRYMAIGAIITGFFATLRNVKPLYVLSLAFMLFAALTGSRGVLVALGATVLLWILIGAVRRGWTVAFSALALSLFTLFTFGPWPIPVLRDRFALLSPTYSAGRDRIWGEASADILSSPSSLITGGTVTRTTPSPNAPGGFNTDEIVNTHNIFLDSLAQAGLVGLILLVVALLAPLPLVVKAIRTSPMVALPALLFFLIFVSAQFSGTQYDNLLLWFFFILTVSQAKFALDAAASQARLVIDPKPAAT